MRFLYNNRIFASDDKINQNTKCIWPVLADIHHILHWVRIMDAVRHIPKFIPDGIIQWDYIVAEWHYIAPDCI